MATKRKKVFYVRSIMVAAREWAPTNHPDDLDEIIFGAGYDFMVELVKLGGRGVMRLKMFDDTWKALKETPEVFDLLTKHHKKSDDDSTAAFQTLISDLQEAGWTLAKPSARRGAAYKPACRECGRPKD